MGENIPSDMQSVQSDQNLHCPHEGTLQPWLSFQNALTKDSDQTAQADLNLH